MRGDTSDIDEVLGQVPFLNVPFIAGNCDNETTVNSHKTTKGVMPYEKQPILEELTENEDDENNPART